MNRMNVAVVVAALGLAGCSSTTNTYEEVMAPRDDAGDAGAANSEGGDGATACPEPASLVMAGNPDTVLELDAGCRPFAYDKCPATDAGASGPLFYCGGQPCPKTTCAPCDPSMPDSLCCDLGLCFGTNSPSPACSTDDGGSTLDGPDSGMRIVCPSGVTSAGACLSTGPGRWCCAPL